MNQTVTSTNAPREHLERIKEQPFFRVLEEGGNAAEGRQKYGKFCHWKSDLG